MEEMLSIPPTHTAKEVYKMLPEGTLAELIEGSIYMTPPPNIEHQDISWILSGEIYNFLKENKIGRAFAAPVGVWLDDETSVQPDILFVSDENASVIRKDAIHGVPDLIIEILSPGNKNSDLVRKKNLYEQFSVREYWIVDANNKESVGYQLINKKFNEFYRSVGNIQSQLLNRTFKF